MRVCLHVPPHEDARDTPTADARVQREADIGIFQTIRHEIVEFLDKIM
jgi:hypothetical protein